MAITSLPPIDPAIAIRQAAGVEQAEQFRDVGMLLFFGGAPQQQKMRLNLDVVRIERECTGASTLLFARLAGAEGVTPGTEDEAVDMALRAIGVQGIEPFAAAVKDCADQLQNQVGPRQPSNFGVFARWSVQFSQILDRAILRSL